MFAIFSIDLLKINYWKKIWKNLNSIKYQYFLFLITMGGGSSKSSKNKNIKNPVQHNWEVIEQGETFNIVRNKTDGR